nr:hypothetical protein CFP56_77990 [Quercus suber]
MRPRGRPVIDLEPHQQRIKHMLDNRSTHQEVLDSLERDCGLVVSHSRLEKAIRGWGMRTRRRKIELTDALTEKVRFFCSRYEVTDKRLQGLLSSSGFGHIELVTLARLRRKLGMPKHISGDEAQQHHKEQIRQLLIAEFNSGRVENLGRKMLYRHMRDKHGIIGRYGLVGACRVALRYAKAKIHRGHLKTPGPNYSWSMDAYCKLEVFGLQIYGIIDVYSRQIVSIYVGITGRTAVSVLAQYVNTIEGCGVMPLTVRSDRGGETPLAADAHFMLSRRKRSRTDGSSLTFTDCFLFGTSKQNSRIETWWRQMGCSISSWRGHFHELKNAGEYILDNRGDRIAFLFIYMPILRTEVNYFVHLWNTHEIRKQKDRPYAIWGKPELIYAYPETPEGDQEPGVQCGIPVNPDDVAAIKADLEGFDLDEYLPQETLDQCTEYLAQAGYTLPINGGDYNADDGQRVHKEAFFLLRDACRDHLREERVPELCETEKPFSARDWQPSDELRRVWEDAGQQLPFADEVAENELQAFYGP